MVARSIKFATPLQKEAEGRFRFGQEPRSSSTFCKLHGFLCSLHYLSGGTLANSHAQRARHLAGTIDSSLAEFFSQDSRRFISIEHLPKLVGVELRPAESEK